MSLASITARGRVSAEARMDSVARIFYEDARGSLNPTTRKQATTYADRIASVPCRFSASADSVAGSETSPASSLGSRLTREVSIPVGSSDVHVGDFLELTTVGPLTDPSLAGIRWRVVDAGPTSQATARRMMVEADR